MKQYNRVYASINLDAIAYNMEQMEKRIGGKTQIMVVIKSDGYGHGAVPIAELSEEVDYVWGYATASLDEAKVLREAGIKKPILVLGCVFPDQYEDMINFDISIPQTFICSSTSLIAGTFPYTSLLRSSASFSALLLK